ncbi:hypothetical protein DACRYDRAFT_20915 [Dacryopinax primogenitus]|uniref:Protein SYM1 n=1 Tax=Dacryopinax primogenitus (strain DJM 731) TaxID=1858805 RepID=M5G889_DACPD|nr:uncharacterized protein DACRYDRAFT_20915 [Dacryopinax primogenitus]EJU04360.1 hypothetical protein DACRYDRAFT_20915 [Dacryopinax primogenitus]
MASILRRYNSLAIRRPLLTGVVSAALLFGAGDVLAQQGVEKRGLARHDYIRTARLTAYGGLIFAPIICGWYGILERLPKAVITSPRFGVLLKVGLDQFVFTPGLIAVFFTSMTLMEGKGSEEVGRRLHGAWAPTLVRNWGVFIPTQLVNFSVVPLQHRLLVVNVVNLFWNTYLSYANSQATKEETVKA